MDVEVIKAKLSAVQAVQATRPRVAAYCRVSTADEEQAKSYDNMVTHYTDYIKSKPEWEFAGVYADKATTGTKVDKREEFKHLINDAMAGKIDIILAKSLSRFARNTLDTLNYVRKLREHNVAIIFEVENINTIKDGEFLLTILSSVAQQEVENTSAYVKKGLKMRMQRGEMVGFNGCLGYDYNSKEKTLTVKPDEAKIVQKIFELYIEGYGADAIARILNEEGYKTNHGKDFGNSVICGILKNEKYTGDLLLGKTYTVDPISKRRVKNKGEQDQYYVRDHHEAIISREIFEEAARIREKRSVNKHRESLPTGGDKYSRLYAFSSITKCGFCGSCLSRRSWHARTDHQKTIWQCMASTKHGKENCPESKGVPEEVIEKAFIEAYNATYYTHKETVDKFFKQAEQELLGKESQSIIDNSYKKIQKLKEKRKKVSDTYLAGKLPEDVYYEYNDDFALQISKLYDEIAEREKLLAHEQDVRERLKRMRLALNDNTYLDKFDRQVFDTVVEEVIVGGYNEDGQVDPYKVEFIFKTGTRHHVGEAKKKYQTRKTRSDKKKTCTNQENHIKDSVSISQEQDMSSAWYC